MRDIPTTVTIGPFQYNVERVNVLTPDKNGEESRGEYDEDGQVIKVIAGGTNATAWLTLFHEVFHGLLAQRNLKIAEGQMDALAYGIIELVRDNPSIFRELLYD